jgi:hypothetical protein
MPSATDDPFAHMNAVASQRAAVAAAAGPEIIVVNKGEEVESVERKARLLGIAKLAGIALIPLIVGIIVGQISNSAATYNKTIEDASILAKDMKRVRTVVQGVYDSLAASRDRGKGLFQADDKELTKELKGLELDIIDPTIAYHSHMYELQGDLVAAILDFYTQSSHVGKLVADHVASAEPDQQKIDASKKKREDGKMDEKVNPLQAKNNPYKYGVYYHIPDEEEAKRGAQPGALFVEIGPPICDDRKPSTTGSCPGAILGFGYRRSGPSTMPAGASSGSPWSLLPLYTPEGEKPKIDPEKLMPLWPTAVLEALLKGNDGTVAEADYLRRLNTLWLLLDGPQGLIQFGADVEKKLKAKANESKKFTFFM